MTPVRKKKHQRYVKGNVVYIQAAILEKTGVLLSHYQIFMLLLDEGMITKSDISLLDVPDLNKYGSSFTISERFYDTGLIPVDTAVRDWPSLFIDKRVENERD